ncbi:hypothetical protein D3C73_1122040 [compost metagenome]
MGHHGVVDQGHAHPLVQFETDRLDQFREFAAVKAPHEPLHIAGQVDFHGARRSAAVPVRRQGAQVGVDQHAVVDVFQALRPVGQPVGRGGRDHVHADADRHVGRGVVRITHAHAAMIHACVIHGGGRTMSHGRMIHPRH